MCLGGLLRRTQDFPLSAAGIRRGGQAGLFPGDYFAFLRDPLWCGAAGVLLGAVAGVQVGERMGPELRQ